jgi:alpha-L-fucosidase
MIKHISIFTAAAALTLLCSCKPEKKPSFNPDSVASSKGTEVFQPDWDNMAANYTCPDWFQDAKFGIFIGWGVYSVPAFGNDWYPRNMYMKDAGWAYKLTYDYHRETYGDQTEFGYKDFIPLFKAEKFDADAWIALFKAAGAKYVIPIAEHHDGFAMYDSDRNPWNAVDMGPRKDIVGLLKAAAEKEGLIFGLSSHRLENAWYFNGGMRIPSDVQDTTLTLYGRRLPQKEYWEPSEYDAAVQLDWLAHTHELIDKYQPQLFWFDWTVNKIPDTFNKFMAYYYNSAVDWGKGVVVNTKQGFPTNVQVWDVERGKSGKMMKYPWQTDTSMGKKSWGYIEGEENKTPEQIVHDLIDIVSKNGNLLLSIGPRADGTITEEQTSILLAIGQWLGVNGEAIYGTRCWKKFGEGPSEASKGSMSDFTATAYTAADLRFTTKGNEFYAIALNWDGNETLIRSLDKPAVADAKILNVRMLGSDEKITWTQTDEGLRLSSPKTRPCDFACTYKITFDRKVGEHLPSEAVDEMMKHGS